MLNFPISYTNGNATIKIYNDGTREIEYPDNEELKLEFPLNIDIRLASKCSFGFNPKTNTAVCDFCHESATTDGVEGDLDGLYEKLKDLPSGVELAIGINGDISTNILRLLYQLHNHGFIINVTVNQGHLKAVRLPLILLLDIGIIQGLGISFRKQFNDFSVIVENEQINLLNYKNTVVHVIAGIDNFEDVKNLSEMGVKKLLVLGEKDFGFNSNRVDLKSKSHREWFINIRKLFNLFEVVSFDNLALEQLNIKRFLADADWKTMYQGEHSMYINAVTNEFSPSSRSSDKVSWDNITLKDYFQQKEMNVI